MMSSTANLAANLIDLGYLRLFQGPDEDALAAVWNQPGAPAALAALAIDPEAPALARFLAAEIMFHQEPDYPPEDQKKELASVYSTALEKSFTGAANAWGLPGIEDGPAGQHLVALGEGAIPQLLRLLTHDTRVYYEGSEEATLGNSRRYRVKDLAAHSISRIRDLDFDMDEDPARRDDRIQSLRNSLE